MSPLPRDAFDAVVDALVERVARRVVAWRAPPQPGEGGTVNDGAPHVPRRPPGPTKSVAIVDVLDDAEVAHRAARGELRRLDLSEPTPVNHAAVARLRALVGKRRRKAGRRRGPRR
jgi:hypothetical protein